MLSYDNMCNNQQKKLHLQALNNSAGSSALHLRYWITRLLKQVKLMNLAILRLCINIKVLFTKKLLITQNQSCIKNLPPVGFHTILNWVCTTT